MALHATRNKALYQLLLSTYFQLSCNVALHATRNKALYQLLLSIRWLLGSPNGKGQESCISAEEKIFYWALHLLWMMADWYSPFWGPWATAHDGCVQPGTAKKSGCDSSRGNASALAVDILLPTRPARGCSSATACQRSQKKRKKKNTPPEPKKKIYLVISGFRVHSCAHLKLFIS